MDTSIQAAIGSIRQQIAKAEQEFERGEGSVTLLAVSKTRPAEDIQAAFDAGQRCFGENYVDEAVKKIDQLAHLPIEWHCIGPLQSNKTRHVAGRFDWFHALDRLKIAERLNTQRPAELAPLNVCIQINLDDEASKSGIQPADAEDFIASLQHLERLKVRGLMVIPKPRDTFEEQRAALAQMRELQQRLSARFALDTLSMGMTDDMRAAIAEGSTMVRVGTAIFGARNYATP